MLSKWGRLPTCRRVANQVANPPRPPLRKNPKDTPAAVRNCDIRRASPESPDFFRNSSSLLRRQILQHFPQRIAAVTDRKFPRVIHFAKRRLIGRIVEQRIVTESLRPALFVQNLSFHLTAEGANRVAVFGQRNDT